MNSVRNVFIPAPKPISSSQGMTNAGVMMIVVVVLIALGVLAFGGYRYLELDAQSKRNAAVDGCMQVSEFRNENSATGVTTVAPMMDVYKTCMEQKGYSVSL